MSWISLKNVGDIGSNLVKIDKLNFIIWFEKYPDVSEQVCLAIYNYNTLSEEWSVLAEHPNEINEAFEYEISYSKLNQQIYTVNNTHIYIDREPELIIYDCKTDKFEQIQHDKEINGKSYMIDINGEINLIGFNERYNYNCHFSWDQKGKQFREICKINEWKNHDDNGRLIHIKSKELLLILGGYSGNNKYDSIWSYSIGSKMWKMVENVKMPFNATQFGAIVTSDEKYIVTFGGFSRYSHDAIWFLDIESLKWTESVLKCPYAGACEAVLMNGNNSNDELLILGFIKSVMNNDINLTSNYKDVTRLIASYYCNEFVHLIFIPMGMCSESRHYKININEIINNSL